MCDQRHETDAFLCLVRKPCKDRNGTSSTELLAIRHLNILWGLTSLRILDFWEFPCQLWMHPANLSAYCYKGSISRDIKSLRNMVFFSHAELCIEVSRHVGSVISSAKNKTKQPVNFNRFHKLLQKLKWIIFKELQKASRFVHQSMVPALPFQSWWHEKQRCDVRWPTTKSQVSTFFDKQCIQ